MIYVLFGIGVAVSAVLLLLARRGERPVARGLLEFFGTVTVALAAIATMQLWLNINGRSIGASSTIAEIEKMIRNVRFTYVQPLNVPGWLQLTAVFVLMAAAILWPNARTVLVLRGLKAYTTWVARAYMFVTLLASFTFFGPIYTKEARAVEARLAQQIGEIDRAYGAYYEELQQAVAEDVAQSIADDPAMAEVLPQLEAIVADVRSHHSDIDAALQKIRSHPHAEVRDFTLTAEMLRRPAVPDPGEGQRKTEARAPRVKRGEWSVAEAESLRSELRTQRSTSPPVATAQEFIAAAVNGTIDAGREPIAKALLAALVTNPALRNALEITIDGLLPNFTNVVAQKTAVIFGESVAGGGVKRAWNEYTSSARPYAAAAASSSVQGVTRLIAQAQETWAARSKAGRDARSRVAQELEQKAQAQYARERNALEATWRARYVFDQPALQDASLRLLSAARGAVESSSNDPLARVAGLRELASHARLDDPASRPVEALVELEKSRGLRAGFSDAVDLEVQAVLAAEGRGEWGWLRRATYEQFETRSRIEVQADEIFQILKGWDRAKRRYAYELIASGGEEPDPRVWERRFHEYCEKNPKMAVMWGWFVKDTNGAIIESRYGRAVPENGYRYYIESEGFGGEAEARRLFSRSESLATITRYCS